MKIVSTMKKMIKKIKIKVLFKREVAILPIKVDLVKIMFLKDFTIKIIIRNNSSNSTEDKNSLVLRKKIKIKVIVKFILEKLILLSLIFTLKIKEVEVNKILVRVRTLKILLSIVRI